MTVFAVRTGVVVIVVAIAMVALVLLVTVSMRGRQKRGAERREASRRDQNEAREATGRAGYERDIFQARADRRTDRRRPPSGRALPSVPHPRRSRGVPLA